MSEFLGIASSTKEHTSEFVEPTIDQDDNHTIKDSNRPRRILSFLSVCEMELIRAINSEIKSSRPNRTSAMPTIVETIRVPRSRSLQTPIDTQLYDPLLPPSVSGLMQQAMHDALICIMAERDQAHAQLIASNVLHAHELEQERRKNEKFKLHQILKDERARLQQPNVANFFQNINDERSRRGLQVKLDEIEKMLAASNDSEIIETARQLAEEVSTKTSHALEIVRLKELREIERRNYDAETKALKEELRQVKALLAEETAKVEEVEKVVVAKESH